MPNLSRRTQAEADVNTHDQHMNDHDPPRSGIVPWIRVLALIVMIAGYVAFVRAMQRLARASGDRPS